MVSKIDRYDGWTVVGHGHAVYIGSSRAGGEDRAYFFAPPGPPSEPPADWEAEEISGTVFEAELDEENERIIPLPDRNWVAETTEDLRAIVEDIRDDIEPDTIAESFEQHPLASDS